MYGWVRNAMRKFNSTLLFLVVATTGVVCRRPPWYKPCWVFLCGLDPIDPVCTWDPQRGAKLFKNECCMKRHNYCYDRNYAIVNKDISFLESLRLCGSLKNLTDPNPRNMRISHRSPSYYST